MSDHVQCERSRYSVASASGRPRLDSARGWGADRPQLSHGEHDLKSSTSSRSPHTTTQSGRAATHRWPRHRGALRETHARVRRGVCHLRFKSGRASNQQFAVAHSRRASRSEQEYEQALEWHHERQEIKESLARPSWFTETDGHTLTLHPAPQPRRTCLGHERVWCLIRAVPHCFVQRYEAIPTRLKALLRSPRSA